MYLIYMLSCLSEVEKKILKIFFQAVTRLILEKKHILAIFRIV